MNVGRSTYTFQLNCDPSKVNDLIQNYLKENKYVLKEVKGEKYYRAGEIMFKGYTYFNYYISGQVLTIQAWVKAVIGEMPLEQNFLHTPGLDYSKSLMSLFRKIEEVNDGKIIINNEQNSKSYAEKIKKDTEKKQELMCEIGFWLSISCLFCSFFGFASSIVIYIANFYFALQGLKTRKKKKAIATIYMLILSIVVILAQLLATA